jgi:TonB family protein
MTKKFKYWKLLAALTVWHVAFAQIDTDEPARTIQLDSYNPPQQQKMASPQYPRQLLQELLEGIVQLTFMVDPEGKPFEIIVNAASGDWAFRRAAIDALQQSTFIPATLNGEPVEARSTFVYYFRIEKGKEGASARFNRSYNEYHKAHSAGRSDRASKLLAELESIGAKNFYEMAFLNLARYQQAQVSGNLMEQMQHLQQALSWSSKPEDKVYFDDETTRELRRALFTLQVNNKYYAQALETLDLIESSGDEIGTTQFSQAATALKSLKLAQNEIAIVMQLDNGVGPSNFKLFRNNFYLADVDGSLDQLQFYCDRKFLVLTPESEIAYELPEAWGDCSVHFSGSPGTRFTLVQI